MKGSIPAFLCLLALGWLLSGSSAVAYERHSWLVVSPDHAQTFAFGSEKNRVWVERGHGKHLAVLLTFTNDPYVDSDNPRRWDNFTFSFPEVSLGKDGRTFYYHAPDGRSIPIASRRPVFLGTEIELLPNAELIVNAPHGYLSLTLSIADSARTNQ